MNGKVWLVGAGPGDPELLTLKGLRVLEEADAVVYDRLVGAGVLCHVPPGAELIDVGKSGGCHPVPQEEIEKILIQKARAGKNVVRLKGGDPFLFGRGGEEMAALAKEGIACELVPGITSAVAVPAYAGIPVTHRGLSSSLHIVTAHKLENAPVNYEALARLEGTLVFLMGASRLGEICQRLIAAGMLRDTPAAVIENGATARQRQILGTLADLPGRAEAAGVRAPAVIVVGDAVRLAGALSWRGNLPLAGKRVLIPRVRKSGGGERGPGKDGRLAKILRFRGAEAIEVAVSRPETMDAPLPRLSGYEWIVFTSAAGVESFFDRLGAESRDVREIGNAKIGVIGPTTENAARSRGLKADLVPAVSDGAALGEALRSAARGRLLLLRAEKSAPDLTEILRDGGLNFDEVPIYRTVPVSGGAGMANVGGVDAVAFTSASSVRNFLSCCPELGPRPGAEAGKAACIGGRTAQAAIEAGYEVSVAKSATLEDLADAIEEAVK